jgi:hypothetical protein
MAEGNLKFVLGAVRPSAKGLAPAALPVDLLRGALGSSKGPEADDAPDAGLGRRTRFASLFAALLKA